MPNSRTFSLPQWLTEKINHLLQTEYQLSLKDTEDLAEAVLKLSNHYIENPSGKTPWNEKWCQVAYLCYYLPLNFLRALAVHQEASRFSFFKDSDEIIDYGSGLGSASLLFKNRITFVETSLIAQKLHQKILDHSINAHWLQEYKQNPGKNSLAIFSYSLTENDSAVEQLLPSWAYACNQIMIIEPSLQDRGRRLMQLRKFLIERGYFIHAPCTHQLSCPLLIHSKNDWCHDRIHFEQPEWFQKLEQHLPMRNQNLTMSYLLVSKSPAALPKDVARITGDQLEEKGKSRQLLCRGPNREYLSWLHKKSQPQLLLRGEMIFMPKNYTAVSNELRIEEKISNLEIKS